jgi:BirA family transcriptional regulator, biotin operon repressor / biotin---[acetyl-CoA-carboxylase] ligase
MPESRLSVPDIAAALGALAPRFDVDVLAECDSTNARLLARAEADAPSGTVVVTERQTAGRGRMGRAWYSDQSASLTFSLLWRLPPGTALGGLSLAVGVAVAEALRDLGVAQVALKWPNDILRDGRKLGGILIELASGSASAAVIGIGVNVRLPSGLPDEVRQSAAALECDVDRNALLARLLGSLHGVLHDFAGGGFAAIRQRWLGLNAHAGATVRIVSAFVPPVDGRCLGVDNDGALLLETATGMRRIISGDVSLRTP